MIPVPILAQRKKIDILNRFGRGIPNRSGAKRTTTPANPPAVPQESKTKTETRTPQDREFRFCSIPLGPIASVRRFRDMRMPNPTMTQTRPDSTMSSLMRAVSLGKSRPEGGQRKVGLLGVMIPDWWTGGDLNPRPRPVWELSMPRAYPAARRPARCGSVDFLLSLRLI